MWREKHRVNFNGRLISVKALAEAFNMPYDSCLYRFHNGERDPWKILYGPSGTPQTLSLTREQIQWLKETARYRRGQTQTRGRIGHRDSEWDIACDLIGVPRMFAKDVEAALGAE